MGCTKCGTDLSSLHLIVKDIIRQLIDEGKLQEGLVDCTDKRLWRDSRVLTCDLLGDAVCQLITNGDICLVKPEALTVEKQDNGSHKISLLMSDGTTLETTARLADGVLNSVTYDAKTKIAKFTTTNGDSYEIKLDIPEPVEYTFTKKDDGVYSVAKDGKELLAINPGVLDVKIEGDKLHVTNAAGEVKQFDIPMPTVTPTELTDNGDGTGSVKYGDTTLPVMTRPTTATKAEDGVVTITNSNGTTVEVPAIKVKAAKEADGKVVITNQDGTTVEIEKSAPATAGLDCAAIDALPERPWKKGTVLLAKQDGECVRLTSLDSIFQEIGVGITADQTNSFTGEKYKVVVTVTNTGEGKNELTNLNIVGPANVEDYDIQDVSFTKSEADEVEQVNDLTYNIRGLKKGGTVKVKYTVVPRAKGTFQFTAAVNPNSPLDKDLGNNNATVILYADTKVKAIIGENCPAITLKDVDTSEVLTQASTVGGDKFNTNPWVGTNPTYIETVQYINIYANRTTLQGLVLEADADITVVANHQKFSEAAAGVGTVDGSIFGAYPDAVGTNPYGNTFISPTTVHEVTTDSVNVSGRRLTVTADANALVLAVRPRGANCYWQVYVILAKSDPLVEKITVTNVTGGVLSNSRVPKGVNTVGDKQFNVVPGTLTTMRKISVGYVEKQIVTVKKGTAATATLDFGKLTKFYSSGLVEITTNSLTVSANATPSDSIRSTYLDVIIEE